MEHDRYESIFLRLARAYVGKYPRHSFKFHFDDREQEVIGSSPDTIEVKFKKTRETLKRIFLTGSLGLGESYCEGLITVDDRLYKYFVYIFVKLLHDKKLLLSLRATDILTVLGGKFNRLFFSKDKENDKVKNINAHYSLSNWFKDEKDANQFYLHWLGSPYIQYTCGKWDAETRTVDEAQLNKLNFYARRLGIDKVSAGKTLLDLGCGWGGLMLFMAENYRVKCKGLTLSTAQAEYIRSETRKRKLEDLVSVEVADAHSLNGKYDYIVSVGLLEHISDYDDLFKRISLSLKEDGAALLHAIFHIHRLYKVDPFLSKYIFPGGSTPRIGKSLRTLKTYFRSVDRNDLPMHSYPKTLVCWYDNFCLNEAKIRELLKEKSLVEDIDFAIRVFKHYLVLVHCGLSGNYSVVSNIVVKN